MSNPLNSLLVCSCITPYSNLIRLAFYFKKISLSALSGSSRARCSVMTPSAVLKRRSEGTKRTEHYPAEIFDTWYHFGQNRSRNRIRKMAGYPANRNRNRISGTSVLITDMSVMCVLQILCVAAVCSPRCTGAQICSNTGPTIRDNSCQCQQQRSGAGCEICMYTLYL